MDFEAFAVDEGDDASLSFERRRRAERDFAGFAGVQRAMQGPLSFGVGGEIPPGEIEVDESYFGARRGRGKRGRGASGETPVLGLHKRGDSVFVSVVENCSKQALMPILKGRVLAESDVYTDGWKACDGLVTNGYKHHRVHHHENEFARGKNHVNGIESFWSFAKMRMSKLHGVKRDKFLLHLKECEWRWNHRRQNTYRLLLSNFRKKPL